MKPLVIFVDDEPNLLSGLKRSLRRDRRSWDAEFALGGQDALRIARDRTPQAIVSDMRMPIMDGTELLRNISAEFPETIRVVLSGEADLDAIHSVSGVCHRYFLKPMENAALANELDTLLAAVAANPRLLRLTRFSCLPSPVEVITALREATGKDPFPADEVRKLILGNVALSAKVIQIANSQYFGRPQPIRSVSRAVDYIGPDSLPALLASAGFADHPADDRINAKLRSLDAAATAICSPHPDSENSDETANDTARSAAFLQFIPALCDIAAMEDGEAGNYTAEEAGFLMAVWGIPHDVVAYTMSLLADPIAPGVSTPEKPIPKSTASILEPVQ